MRFAWPLAFPALAIIPLVLWMYRRGIRRQHRRRAELAAQGFVPSSSSIAVKKRRHVPFAFFLAALTLLLFGMTRPQTEVSTLVREGTVILAFDISNSMLADDIEPTRMAAAKAAALSFVKRQPSNIRIGVVAFSDTALVTQQPSTDRDKTSKAIERLSAGGGTSLGQGIFQALESIAGKPIDVDPAFIEDESQEVDIGYFSSSAIVLLSDGENTSDPDPKAIAKLASLAGVKMYPIGVGSEEGTVVKVDGYTVATALDEALLTELADTTDGTYFRATDAESLTEVYNSIDLKWETRREFTEVTGFLAAGAAVLMALGSLLSILWLGRVV